MLRAVWHAAVSARTTSAGLDAGPNDGRIAPMLCDAPRRPDADDVLSLVVELVLHETGAFTFNTPNSTSAAAARHPSDSLSAPPTPPPHAVYPQTHDAIAGVVSVLFPSVPRRLLPTVKVGAQVWWQAGCKSWWDGGGGDGGGEARKRPRRADEPPGREGGGPLKKSRRSALSGDELGEEDGSGGVGYDRRESGPGWARSLACWYGGLHHSGRGDFVLAEQMFGSSMDFGGESADSLFTICQRQNLVTAQLWREKLPSLIDSATTVAHQARSCKPSLPTCSVLLTIVYNRGAALLSTRPGDRTAVCQLLRSTKVACDLIRTALYPLLHTLENPSRPSSSGTSSVNSSIALVLARHQENTSKVFVSSRAELTNDSPLDIAAAALILEQLTNLVFNQEGLVVNDSISESLAALQDAASRIVWLCSVHSLFRSDWSFMPILKRLRTLQLEATPSQIPAVNSLPVAAVSTVLLGTCSARSGLADTGAILSEVEEVAKSHRSGLANFVAGWICRLIDIRDERAKFYFERALVDYGTSAPVALLAQMGIVAVENADYELALLYFQASLEKDSTFMTSLVGKAVVARSLGWRAQEQDFLIRAVQEMYNRVRLIPRPALPSGLDPIRLLCWLTEVAPPQLSSPLLQKLEPYFSDLKALSHTPSRETRSNQLIPLNRLQRATIFVHLAAKSRVAARNSAREVLALDMWDPIACLGLLRCSVEGKSDASRDESEQNEESEWIEEANTFEEPFAVQEALQAGLRLVSLVETVWGDEPAVGRAAKPNNRPLGLRGFSATCGIPGVETVWTTAPEGVVHRIRKDQSLQRVLRHRSYHGLLGEAYGNLSTVLSMLGHSDQAVWFSNQAELLLPEKKTSVLFNTCLLELRRGGLNSAAPRWIGLRLRQSLEALPPRGVLALLARSMVADGHPLERAAALAGIAVPGKAPSRASGEEDGEAEEEGEAVVSPASIRWMDLQCLRALLKQPQHD